MADLFVDGHTCVSSHSSSDPSFGEDLLSKLPVEVVALVTHFVDESVVFSLLSTCKWLRDGVLLHPEIGGYCCPKNSFPVTWSVRDVFSDCFPFAPRDPSSSGGTRAKMPPVFPFVHGVVLDERSSRPYYEFVNVAFPNCESVLLGPWCYEHVVNSQVDFSDIYLRFIQYGVSPLVSSVFGDKEPFIPEALRLRTKRLTLDGVEESRQLALLRQLYHKDEQEGNVHHSGDDEDEDSPDCPSWPFDLMPRPMIPQMLDSTYRLCVSPLLVCRILSSFPALEALGFSLTSMHAGPPAWTIKELTDRLEKAGVTVPLVKMRDVDLSLIPLGSGDVHRNLHGLVPNLTDLTFDPLSQEGGDCEKKEEVQPTSLSMRSVEAQATDCRLEFSSYPNLEILSSLVCDSPAPVFSPSMSLRILRLGGWEPVCTSLASTLSLLPNLRDLHLLSLNLNAPRDDVTPLRELLRNQSTLRSANSLLRKLTIAESRWSPECVLPLVLSSFLRLRSFDLEAGDVEDLERLLVDDYSEVWKDTSRLALRSLSVDPMPTERTVEALSRSQGLLSCIGSDCSVASVTTLATTLGCLPCVHHIDLKFHRPSSSEGAVRCSVPLNASLEDLAMALVSPLHEPPQLDVSAALTQLPPGFFRCLKTAFLRSLKVTMGGIIALLAAAPNLADLSCPRSGLREDAPCLQSGVPLKHPNLKGLVVSRNPGLGLGLFKLLAMLPEVTEVEACWIGLTREKFASAQAQLPRCPSLFALDLMANPLGLACAGVLLSQYGSSLHSLAIGGWLHDDPLPAVSPLLRVLEIDQGEGFAHCPEFKQWLERTVRDCPCLQFLSIGCHFDRANPMRETRRDWCGTFADSLDLARGPSDDPFVLRVAPRPSDVQLVSQDSDNDAGDSQDG